MLFIFYLYNSIYYTEDMKTIHDPGTYTSVHPIFHPQLVSPLPHQSGQLINPDNYGRNQSVRINEVPLYITHNKYKAIKTSQNKNNHSEIIIINKCKVAI